MAHDMSTDMEAATVAPVVAPVIFVLVQTNSGTVRLWSGFGNISWAGETWVGGGQLLEIGSVTEQNKVQASGTALTLTGVDQANIALVLEDLQRYLPAQVWLGAIDDMFQIVSDPFQILNGRVDKADIMLSATTATITVLAESRLVAMRIPRVRRYTDLDQRLEHPGDGGFTYVDTIQDAQISFHG